MCVSRGKILTCMWQRKQQLVRDVFHCAVFHRAPFYLVGMDEVCDVFVDQWSELTPVVTAC